MANTTRNNSTRSGRVKDAKAAPITAAASADGVQDHLVLEAQRDITIRCGKASITLTAAGKIILRGTHIASRSSGVQRIKGGSVQIN